MFTCTHMRETSSYTPDGTDADFLASLALKYDYAYPLQVTILNNFQANFGKQLSRVN